MLQNRKIIVALSRLVFALSMVTCAQTAVASDFKFGIFAGGSSAKNETISETAPITLGGVSATITNAYLADKKTGYLLGVTAGVENDRGFIFEGEIAYRKINFDASGTLSVDVAGTAEVLPARGSGAISTVSFMANSWFDIFDRGTTGIRPFIGGGIGVAVKKVRGSISSEGQVFGFDINNITGFGTNSNTGFAWQVGAGVRINLSKNTVSSLSYRYFDGGKFNNEFDVASHNIVFAVSF